MKIVRKYVEKDTLEGFADKHNLTMVVFERDFPEAIHRYFCHFEHAEIGNGTTLVSEHGNGGDEVQAMTDYAERISGKLLVIDAYTPHRREIRVPKLTYGGTA